MIKTSTHHDIIRFIYDETSKKENKELQKLIAADEELLEEFMQIIILKSSLDKVCINPSEQTIRNILKYSKNFDEHV